MTAEPHPLQPSGLRTRGIPSRCSPPVCHLVARPHCRVCVRNSRACRLKALNAVLPHSQIVTSPRRHSSPSRPTSQTASPWAAQWACGSSQKESDQQSSQLLSTSHQSGFALVVLMPVLPDLNTSPIPRSVLPIWLNSSSFTGSEKREDHVPHMVFFEDTLFTHASFAHQCVFTTGTAGSRQGHPATRQAHSHSGTPLTAGGPGFHDSTH